VEFAIRSFDPDNDLRQCEMYVDGVHQGWAAFDSPHSGATATWTYAFTNLGLHTVSFYSVDLADHSGPGDAWQ